MTVSLSERALSCVGAVLGLLFSGWLCHEVLGSASPWLIAPMGASAVLLFAVPASPLAQPWSIFAGNLISALIGVTCASWLGHDAWVAALAGGLAIAGMFALRCLHPPGGAVALTAVLAGSEVAQLGYHFALYPVGLNSIGLLLIALLFNNVLRRQYPHRPLEHGNVHKTRDPIPRDRLSFTPADLDAVLKARGELLDISREDLEEILLQTEARAYQRRFGEVRCADIMSRDVQSLTEYSSLAEARLSLHKHRLSAMPVLNPQGELQGMLSLHDLLLADADTQTVSQCMRRQAPTCRADWPVTYLLQMLTDSDVHRLPVVDDQRQLLGIVSQSDLLAALFRMSLQSSASGTG
ncbi:HPP family protein [Pseudomonas sp.]|uniref:HPP family protein n=1 Tax=Pseudomonas sp. TaxID=306 RepID=UPI003BB5E807